MKKSKIKIFGLLAAVVLTGGIFTGCGSASDDTVSIVNVSYDPTRELYSEYNKIFAEHWKEKTGQDVHNLYEFVRDGILWAHKIG